MFQKVSGKKAILLLLVLIMLTIVMVGCKRDIETDSESNQNNTDIEENTIRTIVDMAGREIEIPHKINKVYSAIPIGTVLIYTIDPNKLVAKNFKTSPMEEKYLAKEFIDLPVLGNYIVGDTANEEQILEAKPDVIVYTGEINDSWKQEVDKIQGKLGIPVVMVAGGLQKTYEAYEFLGELLDEKHRAKELGEYCKQVLDKTEEISSKIPQDKRIKIYYAIGEDGLASYPAGKTMHSELVNLINGINVVNVGDENPYMRVEVSMEQILNWDPDVIITNKAEARGGGGTDLRTKLLKDGKWSNINAIKSKKIYEIPSTPFSWFGEPPSVARIMGLKWIGSIIYPQYFEFDLENEAKDFYKKFYNIELTENNLNEILNNSILKQ
ncbi:MAG TPA: ABC transporter substrate-binding protein [Clostridia bacterium]|nr:ABC transporter substrate-binding protein [Clostridia bacterium]